MFSSPAELIHNLALLVLLGVLSGFLRRPGETPLRRASVQGALFGLITVLAMREPLVLGPGLFLDTRSIGISLCALFFGPVAVGIAGSMAIFYRMLLGGAGLPMGLVIIGASAVSGLYFHGRWVRAGVPLTTQRLLVFGALVHATLLLLLAAYPWPVALSILRRVGLPVLLGVPLIILFLGKLLASHETQARTAEKLRQVSTAVEQSPVSVVITDTRGAIEYVNPKFTELTGYTFEEALGQNPRFLKSGELPAEAYRDLWRTIQAGGIWRGEFHNRKKNGELYWELASISPIRDAGGTITSFVAVKEDITQRKQAEQDRLEMERKVLHDHRLESLGVLAGTVAHDFNNILTSILGNAEVARLRLGEGHPLHKHADNILIAGRRARDLVQKILQFSRQDDSEREPLPAAQALEDVLIELRKVVPATISLQVEVEVGDAAVLMNRAEMAQVLMHLSMNALQAMAKATSGVLSLAVHPQAWDGHPGVEFVVGDTGPGIPPEIRDRIFEPFFTTKGVSEGPGLGLSVVHGIIKRSGGSIQVESEVGVGSRFKLRLQEAGAPPSQPVSS